MESALIPNLFKDCMRHWQPVRREIPGWLSVQHREALVQVRKKRKRSILLSVVLWLKFDVWWKTQHSLLCSCRLSVSIECQSTDPASPSVRMESQNEVAFIRRWVSRVCWIVCLSPLSQCVPLRMTSCQEAVPCLKWRRWTSSGVQLGEVVDLLYAVVLVKPED